MSEGKKVAGRSLNTIPKGFTLSEILVALAIVGVIAALMIPVVVKNYQKQVMATRLEKVYSEIIHAFMLARVKNGDPKYWDIAQGDYGGEQFASKYLFPHLRVIKNCGTNSTQSDCNYKYRYKDDPSWITPDSRYTRFFLKDGTFIAMYTMRLTLYGYSDGTIWLGSTSQLTASQLASWGFTGFTYRGIYVTNDAGFLIDINGSKGPNMNGRDVFWFDFYGDGNSHTTPAGVTTINPNNGKFVPGCYGSSIEELKGICKEYGSCCADILYANAWNVPSDYPWD